MIYVRLDGLRLNAAYSIARVEVLMSELLGEWRVMGYFSLCDVFA